MYVAIHLHLVSRTFFGVMKSLPRPWTAGGWVAGIQQSDGVQREHRPVEYGQCVEHAVGMRRSGRRTQSAFDATRRCLGRHRRCIDIHASTHRST